MVKRFFSKLRRKILKKQDPHPRASSDRAPRNRQHHRPSSAAEGSGETWEPSAAGKPARARHEQKDRATASPSSKRRRKRRTAEARPWSLDEFKVEPVEGKTRFHDLGLPDPLMHAICDLGFEYCTPIQAKALSHAREGQNVAGRAQTGTGKTAAFLAAIFAQFIARPPQGKRLSATPRALVIAPTRELVIQIAKDAESLGKHCHFNCVAVYGGMDFGKQLDELDRGPVDLVAATPGRLLDFVQRNKLNLRHVEVLIIDEADRMLDMGFIPDVRRIIRNLPGKDKRQTMLFSATLTDDVMRLASQWMPDPVVVEIEPEQVAVDTVDQLVYAVPNKNKFALLYNLLNKNEVKRTLVFTNRRDRTERITDELRRRGMKCEMLSGSVAQKKRVRVLEEFREGKIPVVIATDVAGRGIHVDDITHVINFDFPYEPEDYVHRIGRTGRAGVEGTAISFACEDESFIIPDIEAYIKKPLTCRVPEDELLAEPPAGSRPRSRPPESDRARQHGGQRGGRRGDGRRPPRRR